MYIWTFNINNETYYGRTWEDFVKFLDILEKLVPVKKYVFVHNLSFEFQFLQGFLDFELVFARKSHKVIKAELKNYNIEFRCSYFMSNVSLDKLAKTYNLNTKKLVGNLDYNKIRHSKTKLTKKELSYCENDTQVVAEYIRKMLDEYITLDRIPLTNTGQVRRELRDIVQKDFAYRKYVKPSINIDTHIYNLLVKCFAGGYTHANWIYTNRIIKNVVSYDFTSSYPYVMLTNKYPMGEFKKCNIKKFEQIIDIFAYIVVVKFKNIKCKFYNNFISKSKCVEISGGRYDNGRVIQAEELKIIVTDVDLKYILRAYKYEEYEIEEAYYSVYKYLPIQFIDFILQKYENKTKYKNVKGKEVEYAIEKGRFNSLYGMSVTNTIRDEVEYDKKLGWNEVKLSNEEIIKRLKIEKNKCFMSFSWGVWVTAYARNNIIQNIIDNDKYVIYSDTDSIKLAEGYNKEKIENYNKYVIEKIKKVSDELKINIDRYKPKDSKGKEHLIGVFDEDGKYKEFITQGAKKYAYTDEEDKIHITVAGVPKSGAKQLKNLNEFKDDLIFDYKYTNKQQIVYCDNMQSVELTDLNGDKFIVNDKSGCCLLPSSYTLGKSIDYLDLLEYQDSSERSEYIE